MPHATDNNWFLSKFCWAVQQNDTIGDIDMRSFSIEAALAAVLLSTACASAASSLPKFDLVKLKEIRRHVSVRRHLEAPTARSTATPQSQLKSDYDKYPSVDGFFSGMNGF